MSECNPNANHEQVMREIISHCIEDINSNLNFIKLNLELLDKYGVKVIGWELPDNLPMPDFDQQREVKITWFNPESLT